MITHAKHHISLDVLHLIPPNITSGALYYLVLITVL